MRAAAEELEGRFSKGSCIPVDTGQYGSYMAQGAIDANCPECNGLHVAGMKYSNTCYAIACFRDFRPPLRFTNSQVDHSALRLLYYFAPPNSHFRRIIYKSPISMNV
jgi:hypothetical protein